MSQLRVASRSCWANAFMACRPASGVGASPKALTKALPTMTPSAPQDITCWACTNPITGNINSKHSSHSKKTCPSCLCCKLGLQSLLSFPCTLPLLQLSLKLLLLFQCTLPPFTFANMQGYSSQTGIQPRQESHFCSNFVRQV